MLSIGRFAIGAGLVILLAYTVFTDFHTVKVIHQFRTNVLWRDQWWFLGEFQSLHKGASWSQILWSPYWGHRPVIPRLLFYLDVKLFSFRNTPLLCLSWASLLLQVVVISAVNRSLFGSILSWRFVAALIVTLNLYLSSFQMENLIWALQIQYILVFTFATLSFTLFASSLTARRGTLLLSTSFLCAFLGSLTMANGLLIWPVLALQAVLCKSSRRVWAGALLAFVLLSGIYTVGYVMPDTGMGLRGQFHRPGRAIEIALMVVGGPLSNQNYQASVVAGAAGILAAMISAFAIRRDSRPALPSIHLAIAAFSAGTAALTVWGRISPEFVKQHIAVRAEMLPSRYQTFSFIFWASLFALALWVTRTAHPRVLKALTLTAAFVPCYFVFAYTRVQPAVADAWLDSMHSFDATGTSFLLNAPDWERQQLLWAYRSQLDGWVQFAREQRLANFSEDRLHWIGSRLTDRFPKAIDAGCEGKLEDAQSISPGCWRVNGWAWERDAHKAPLDVVLVDASGYIRGLARSGQPHHDTGGHSPEVIIYRAGWLGYVNTPNLSGLRAYAVLQGENTVCQLH